MRGIKMGGRGASFGNGNVAAVAVNYGGSWGTYRKHDNGMVTDIDDWADVKNTNGIDLNEIAKRARASGYEVKTYTPAELKRYDKDMKQARANKPDYENGAGVAWGNQEYRKKARRERLASRAQKRR